MKSNLWILVLAVSLNSCTNKQVYDSVQNSQQFECSKLQTVQRDECLKRLGLPYDKYEEERQKLLKKNEKPLHE